MRGCHCSLSLLPLLSLLLLLEILVIPDLEEDGGGDSDQRSKVYLSCAIS